MFVGHFAPALVAATHKKSPSLPVLFVAAQLVDWAFFAFILIGWEAMRITPGITVMNPLDLYDMPYTHSLLGAAIFGGVAMIFVWLVMRRRGRSEGPSAAVVTGFLTGLVVVSHWFLDLLVHTHDLTLTGSPRKYGLALWNHPAIEMPLEMGITLGALWWFARTTNTPRAGVIALGVLLMVMQGVQWFGPPPERADLMFSMTAFAAYAGATLVAWWAVRPNMQRE